MSISVSRNRFVCGAIAMRMVESHSRGGAAGANSDCPDKYVPDETRDVDRSDYGTVYYGMTTDGYLHWSHRHLDESYGVREHRLLAVAEWGLDAVSGKIVHHKNGIGWDNRVENLEIKTQAEHVKDHFEEGGYGRSKLTAEDVAELRRDYTGDVSIKELAEDYPVSEDVLRRALRGETWEWVDEPPATERYTHSTTSNTKLSEEDVKEIRNRYEPYQTTQKELAEDYGVTPTAIGKIVKGDYWQGVGEQ